MNEWKWPEPLSCLISLSPLLPLHSLHSTLLHPSIHLACLLPSNIIKTHFSPLARCSTTPFVSPGNRHRPNWRVFLLCLCSTRLTLQLLLLSLASPTPPTRHGLPLSTPWTEARHGDISLFGSSTSLDWPSNRLWTHSWCTGVVSLSLLCHILVSVLFVKERKPKY